MVKKTYGHKKNVSDERHFVNAVKLRYGFSSAYIDKISHNCMRIKIVRAANMKNAIRSNAKKYFGSRLISVESHVSVGSFRGMRTESDDLVIIVQRENK